MTKSFFAPELIVKNVADGMEFYQKALGASVLRQWDNPDGTVHVAEMEINGALFHIHEETGRNNHVSPAGSTTVVLGLFVDDVNAVISNAESAGGRVSSPVEDYDYGYRQGTFHDPFGHQWMIEKRI